MSWCCAMMHKTSGKGDFHRRKPPRPMGICKNHDANNGGENGEGGGKEQPVIQMTHRTSGKDGYEPSKPQEEAVVPEEKAQKGPEKPVPQVDKEKKVGMKE
eukprot:TRINITY_DN966_c0_g1_i4.p1 TRINITY_DN966_c0_g1~~TRINITY_DN966_c0_g1_i4.p1  ORF type:complete len:101 (+),score=19.60 TRINITY_DN966_c0_g1_i4:82-384(+)